MRPIAQWLQAHGLSAYIDLFQQEQIDLEVLPHLTDADLKALGMPTGPRVKLLVAARRLHQPYSAPAETVAGKGDAEKERDAERRQLTILFCDLVGSTALSQQLDPEPLRELMQSYQQTCRGVIQKYEGHVAQYLGDGLMVYFGWPYAHEDDAERAVRAALDLKDAVKMMKTPRPLQVRIGIATGPVVVGETGDGDASVPKLAVGETPNLAARLQAIAHADQIVIAPSTRRLIGAVFEIADLGEHALKGINGRVHVFTVTDVGPGAGRFAAARAALGLTPIVGREDEIAVLSRRWQQAKMGEGHVVLVSGEAGIGKSRMVQELIGNIADNSRLVLRAQCSPFHTNSALYPLIDVIERVPVASEQITLSRNSTSWKD